MKTKVNKNVVSAILVLLMLMLSNFSMAPAQAWVYPDGTEDTDYERFGPRVDTLLIKVYPDVESEWAALEFGKIDLTDCPLTMDKLNKYSTSPYNERIGITSHGLEFATVSIGINNNPVVNGYSNPCSDINFRRALWHLMDRWFVIANIWDGLAVPQYTPIPASMGPFVHPDIIPGGALEELAHLYDPTYANQILDWAGYFDWDGDGWRNYPDWGPNLPPLKFYIRVEDPRLGALGDWYASQLNSAGIQVAKYYCGYREFFYECYIHKDFHLCTDIQYYFPEPFDPLTRYHSKYYWHPGISPNYGGVNCSAYDDRVNQFLTSITFEEIINAALKAQEIFNSQSLGAIPVLTPFGYMAYYKTYTDGHNWTKIVNIPGVGIDNFWSILNMHPESPEAYLGDVSDLTLRWGFGSYYALDRLNPVYVSNIWEKKVLSLIYEPLLRRHPYYTFGATPWLAEDLEVGTYIHPMYGECSKVSVTLSDGIYWADGPPVTALDVYFTFVELKQILEQHGYPPPTWLPKVDHILDFKILDPYNFEILFDNLTLWRLEPLLDVPILPKHIWQHIIEDPNQDVMAPMPDPNLVGSGPWNLTDKNEGLFKRIFRNLKEKVMNGIRWLLGAVGNYIIEKRDGLKTKLKKINWNEVKNFIKNIRVNVKKELLKKVLDEILGVISPDVGIDVYLYYKKPPMKEYELLGSATISLMSLGDVGSTAEALTLPATEIAVGPQYVKINIRVWAEVAGMKIEKWFNENCVLFWFTIYEDIVGSTFYDDIGLAGYPYKSQLPSPDFKVDIFDCVAIALAFGSTPGQPNWNPNVDIYDDYKVDIFDLVKVALKFGWPT